MDIPPHVGRNLSQWDDKASRGDRVTAEPADPPPPAAQACGSLSQAPARACRAAGRAPVAGAALMLRLAPDARSSAGYVSRGQAGAGRRPPHRGPAAAPASCQHPAGRSLSSPHPTLTSQPALWVAAVVCLFAFASSCRRAFCKSRLPASLSAQAFIQETPVSTGGGHSRS